jgi:hypothetical protein
MNVNRKPTTSQENKKTFLFQFFSPFIAGVVAEKLHSNEVSRKPGCATAMWLKTMFCRFQAKIDRCGRNGVSSIIY